MNPGDRVRLLSGSPPMIVADIVGESAHCVWFCDELKKAEFPLAVLGRCFFQHFDGTRTEWMETAPEKYIRLGDYPGGTPIPDVIPPPLAVVDIRDLPINALPDQLGTLSPMGGAH